MEDRCVCCGEIIPEGMIACPNCLGVTGKNPDTNGVTFATYNNVCSKWIPVTERLPEDDSDVLAYLRIGEEGRIYPANYAKGMWFDCIFNTPATNTTTHWMPLPEPPKEEKHA